jgi:glycosyltransferase involved in cell wall biosynthesis
MPKATFDRPEWWRAVSLPRDARLFFRLRRHGGKPVVAVGVHAYEPSIGGSELHARCIAEQLTARGYEVVVATPRGWRDPFSINSIPVGVHRFVLRACDVLVTYSLSAETLRLAEYATRLPARTRPTWLHHPCAVGGKQSLELIRACDAVIAMNPADRAIAARAGRSDDEIARIRPASHPCKLGRRGDRSFRNRYQIEGDYILWLGAWLPAKGVRSLSRRFAALRARRPDLPVKLVMFGGYAGNWDGAEFPEPHSDILCVNNSTDLASALSGCTFLAFNAPPHPVGYDANPLVLLEAMMNGKTFVAQAGTPILPMLAHLGKVVETDREWLDAAERLLVDARYRAWLERRCQEAYQSTYNIDNMTDDLERAIAQTRARAANAYRVRSSSG